MHRNNRICLISNEPSGSKVIFPLRKMHKFNDSSNSIDDDFIVDSNKLTRVLRQYFSDLSSSVITQPITCEDSGSYSLSQAISIGLCIMHRQIQKNPKLQPRFLVVQLSKDKAVAYNSIMNCIFSAQKMGAAVDSVVLAREHSPFLQQASYISGGVYLHPINQNEVYLSTICH